MVGEAFVSKDSCDVFKVELKEHLTDIKDNIKTLFKRLNWFYIVAIGTLASSLGSIVLSVVLLLTLKK